MKSTRVEILTKYRQIQYFFMKIQIRLGAYNEFKRKPLQFLKFPVSREPCGKPRFDF